jgi:hypothetical protein
MAVKALSINRSSNFTFFFFWSPTKLQTRSHPPHAPRVLELHTARPCPEGKSLSHIKEGRHTHLERRSGPRRDIPVCFSTRAHGFQNELGVNVHVKKGRRMDHHPSEHRSSSSFHSSSKPLLGNYSFWVKKKNRKEKDENRAALPLIVECEHEEVNKRDSLICFGSPNDDAQYAAIPLLGLRVPTDGAQ